MRKLALGAIVGVGAGIGFFVQGSLFERGEIEKVQPRMVRADDVKNAGAAAPMERLVVGHLAQADVTSQRLDSLEQRVRALEAACSADDAEERAAATDSYYAEGAPKTMPEDALGQWLFDSLRRGNGNSEWTSKAESEVEQRLSKLPGVEVEAVECGDRFGHVKFFRRDGAQPDVVPLLGLPPFDGESFTTPNEDGSVSVYFTAPGVKLQELRDEATAAAG